MEEITQTPPPPSTPPDCCHYSYSTGYLEDALIQFSLRFKRQRLWTENYDFLKEETGKTTNFESFSESKSIEEVISMQTNINYDEQTCFSTESSSISIVDNCQDDDAFTIIKSIKKEETMIKRTSTRKRKSRRVVTYPFATVKPGGIDGVMTLDDINKRIKMPPSKPVRHPVGDYACHPCVISPHGPGLSGKPVVALTTIHTQGRGTITIIRTKD